MPALVFRMPVELRQQPVEAPRENAESFDMYELADDAAEALEGYRRAPWSQLSTRLRIAKLRKAIELLQRVEALETGRIPAPLFGD